jgi:hypothetical protein
MAHHDQFACTLKIIGPGLCGGVDPRSDGAGGQHGPGEPEFLGPKAGRHLGLTMGSKFYTRFKDQIRLGSDPISIHF